MSSIKFFNTPFALNGTRNSIPDPTQANGSVSFNQGYGPDYAIANPADPNYKSVDNPELNELQYLITNEIQQYQTNGIPDYIDPSLNGGSPYPYTRYARVKGTDGLIYESLIDNNTDSPPSNNWVNIAIISSFYTDSGGAPNVYVLAPADGKQEPSAYSNGLKIGFVPEFSNTGSSTIQIGSLPPVNVYQNFNSPTNINQTGIKQGLYQEFIYRNDPVNGDGFVLISGKEELYIGSFNDIGTDPDILILTPFNGVNPINGIFPDGATLTFRNSISQNTGSQTVTASIENNPDMQNIPVKIQGNNDLPQGSIRNNQIYKLLFRRTSPLRFEIANANATTDYYGQVLLNNTITSTSTTSAATANAARLASLFTNFTFNIGNNGSLSDNDTSGNRFLFQWGGADVTYTQISQSITLNFNQTFGAVWHVFAAPLIENISPSIIVDAAIARPISFTNTQCTIAYQANNLLNPSGRVSYFAIGRL